MQKNKILLFIFLFCASCTLFSKPAELDPRDVNTKVNELLFTHISQKKLTTEIIKRAFDNYIEDLDSLKTYFLQSEVDPYLNPTEEFLTCVLEKFYKSDFSDFTALHEKMLQCVSRRSNLEKKIDESVFLDHVTPKEIESKEWATDEQELYERLLKIKSFQKITAEKIEETNFKSKFLKLVEKRRKWREEQIRGKTEKAQSQIIHAQILKAIASSLDSQTMYFPPEEASIFLMQVQQRLMGIGVQLTDDITGLKIMSLIDGGPAKVQGELKENDLIVAVDNEYVVGMDINQSVQLIRGKEHTKVKLTVLRSENEDSDEFKKFDVTIVREEIVIEESRLESAVEPFGDGHIGHLTLHSFYQDPQSSCAQDLYNKLDELKKNYYLKGVVLDLRNNLGGLLPQAVAVNSLFMGKGIVVSIKNYDGTIQHLRSVEPDPLWTGPLVVLVNKLSASAAEIVAQSLQDYGRAIVIGDERSFGKGTFQQTTFNIKNDRIDPKGEYKVTQGMYYTVSGKSPQLVGVKPDIVAPSYLAEAEIGEEFSKYPVQNESIQANFEDRLDDVPPSHLNKIKRYYHFDLQPRLSKYTDHLVTLKKNSEDRITSNKDYQNFLEILKETENTDSSLTIAENDLQLLEAFNILKDLIYLDELKAPAPAA
ncbi:MAG: hypothetical protein S4CHLAM7_02710 [Chlamydiae bacterium]|nr:hypothetical protein [Chlamydiota bacterium]